MTTFIFHGWEGVDPAGEFGPLRAEFERRGFPCRIIRSPRQRTKTPNQDRAKILLDALRDEQDDIALIGISNQGLFMPLVAAARPIRRIVMLNAVVPFPGQSFWQATKNQRVWTNRITWLFARRSPGMNEVCPLTALPQAGYVYICGANDDAINPAWERQAARDYLHVEPVVIPGAMHADIVYYVRDVVDAATRGLTPSRPPQPTSEAEPHSHTSAPALEQVRPDGAAAPSSQQVDKPGWQIANALISGLAPVLSYLLIRPHVASDVVGLAIAWLFPIVWLLVSSLWRRRFNVMALLGVAAYGIALGASIFTGAGSLPLKLHHAVVGGLVGLVFLGSVAVDRPILLLIMRRATKNRPQVAVNAMFQRPAFRRRMTQLTLVFGVAALADAGLQTALALSLSTSDFLIVTPLVHIVVIAGAIGVAFLMIRMRFREAA